MRDGYVGSVLPLCARSGRYSYRSLLAYRAKSLRVKFNKRVAR